MLVSTAKTLSNANGRVQSRAQVRRSTSSTSVLDTSHDCLHDRYRYPPSAFLEVTNRNWTSSLALDSVQHRETVSVASTRKVGIVAPLESSVSQHRQREPCSTGIYGKNKRDVKRSTSEPIPPKRSFSPPSQLHTFPPPLPDVHMVNPPFRSQQRRKLKGDQEHRSQEKENKPQKRYEPVIDDDGDEEDEDELDDIMIEYQPRGRTLIRVRKKLTERTIISTPRYSPSPNSQSSRSPSIRKSSVSPPLTRSSSFTYLSFTAPSQLPSPSEDPVPAKHPTGSRLSNPLPLPPGFQLPTQAGAASIEQRSPGTRYYQGGSGRSSIRRLSYTGSSPRYRTSSSRSISRPPSPHPSSSPTGSSLKSPFTRSSSSPSLLSYPTSASPGLGGRFPSPRLSYHHGSPSPSPSSGQPFLVNRRASTSRSTVRFSDSSLAAMASRPRSNS